MKVAYITKAMPKSPICIGDFSVPKPEPHTVLIQVIAVAVNAVDTFIRNGIYTTPLQNPAILGRDAVGRVVQCGAEVSDFHEGDLVWTNSMGYDGRQGVASQYALVPADRLYPAPKNVPALSLVASVHAAATAAIVLTDIMQLQAGQTILIQGAAGHVGKKLVELAHQKGASVTTLSSPKDFTLLEKLGSQRCLDYHQAINLETLGMADGFDHIINTSGKQSLAQNAHLLTNKGQITLITTPPDTLQDVKTFYMKSQRLVGFVISRASQEQLKKAADILNDAFSKEFLLEDDYKILPLEAIGQAYQEVEEKSEKRKIILTMEDN